MVLVQGRVAGAETRAESMAFEHGEHLPLVTGFSKHSGIKAGDAASGVLARAPDLW